MAHIQPANFIREMFKLCDVLDCGSNSGFRADCAEIRRAAMRLSNIGERECNGVIGPDGFAKWDDADQAKADADRNRAEKRVNDALDRMFDAETRKRIVVEFQGDPRGPSVKIGTQERPNIATAW